MDSHDKLLMPEAYEMEVYKWMLKIKWSDTLTNESVLQYLSKNSSDSKCREAQQSKIS